MNVDQIIDVTTETAQPIELEAPPAGEASEGWTEAEFHAVSYREDSYGGIWEGEAGEVWVESWPHNEFCVVVSGHIALEDTQGGRRDYREGSAFVIPQGFRGRWITVTASRKYFVAMPAAEAAVTAIS